MSPVLPAPVFIRQDDRTFQELEKIDKSIVKKRQGLRLSLFCLFSSVSAPGPHFERALQGPRHLE